MSIRARLLSKDDAADWARFAQKIVPLPGKAVPHHNVGFVAGVSPASEAVRAPSRRGRLAGTATSIGSIVRPDPIGVGARPAGVDTASWQKFHRGQLGSARKLDLHGMTAQQAFHALRAFLRDARSDGLRCVEIVTGRGDSERGGVLRREFGIWLNLPEIRPMVLAAVHPHTSGAMHSHAANTGSVRLLLRKSRA